MRIDLLQAFSIPIHKNTIFTIYCLVIKNQKRLIFLQSNLYTHKKSLLRLSKRYQNTQIECINPCVSDAALGWALRVGVTNSNGDTRR